MFPQPAAEEEGGERPAEDRAAVGGAGRLEGVHADEQRVGHPFPVWRNARVPGNLFGYHGNHRVKGRSVRGDGSD